MKFLITTCIGLFSLACGAQGQNQCRVLDPELVGQYQGDCRGGLADGYGFARGVAEYRGDFRAGRKHGNGVKVWLSTNNRGDRYEGEFVEDRKEGVGIYIWSHRGPSAGEKYVGSFLNDRRHGKGTYEWPSGDRYAGTWDNDAPTGPLTPMMRARVLAETAAFESVGRPGVRVCRAVPVGISNRDWIRGEVIGADTGRISVRIDDPGRQSHEVDNVVIEKGTIVSSNAIDWNPCP